MFLGCTFINIVYLLPLKMNLWKHEDIPYTRVDKNDGPAIIDWLLGEFFQS